jgi:hypothetical protein
MGLLDDAIREHLELKRSHGADPAEVAAQEREVLGAGQQPAADSAPTIDEPQEPVAEAPPVEDERLDPFADVDAPPVSEEPIGQPTVEYDVLAETTDPRAADRFAPEADLDWSEPAAEPAEPAAEEDDPEDVLEETPEFLEETPEHDRLWFEQRPPKDFDF